MNAESPYAEQGKRLRAVRLALGIDQTELAKLMGAKGHPAVSNWESGRNQVPLQAAIRLWSRRQVSLDWLYLGVRHAMPVALLEKIDRETGGEL